MLYPFGLSDTASTAASPLLGALLSALLPHGKTIAVVLIGVGAIAVALSLVVRPPTTTAAAAHRLALGLTIAILLSPATRIGYAVYPLTLLIWARCTVLAARAPPRNRRRTRASAVQYGTWPWSDSETGRSGPYARRRPEGRTGRALEAAHPDGAPPPAVRPDPARPEFAEEALGFPSRRPSSNSPSGFLRTAPA